MTRIHNLGPAIVIAAALASIGCGAEAVRSNEPSAEGAGSELAQLLACHDRSMGGQRLRELAGLGYELEIVEPDFTVRGSYRVTREGRARIDVFIDDQRVFSEGVNEHGTWQLHQGASQAVRVTGEPADALRHGVEQPGHLWTLADMEANGHALELLEPESIDGVTYPVVKLTLSDGFENWYWLDPTTCRIERQRNFRSFHPDLDPSQTWIEQINEDFREVSGITKSYRSRNVDLRTGETIATNRILSIEIDPELAPELLDPPVVVPTASE